MADIMLRTSSPNQVTCIANSFIDNFMKDANGEYVKIYLYLMRCLGRDGMDFSISAVADRLDCTEKDVMRAFTYWEKVGLLRLEYDHDELSGICLVDVTGHDEAIQPVVSAPAVTTAKTTASIATQTELLKPSYSLEAIDEFASSDAVKELFCVAETYLGRPLSKSDTDSILFWFDSLHMSLELIEFLMEHCIDNGHSSFHYMDTVARNWFDDGIHTVAEASLAVTGRSNVVSSVIKAMGISGKALNDVELAFVEKWTSNYGFSVDIICEACHRTVASTGKPTFKYADSILKNWHDANVKNFDAIINLDNEHSKAAAPQITAPARTGAVVAKRTRKNAFTDINTRDEDLDALERSLLKKN